MAGTSKYIGVHWRRYEQQYRASICHKGVRIECGYAKNERDAAILRDRKILALGLDIKKLQILKPLKK